MSVFPTLSVIFYSDFTSYYTKPYLADRCSADRRLTKAPSMPTPVFTGYPGGGTPFIPHKRSSTFERRARYERAIRSYALWPEVVNWFMAAETQAPRRLEHRFVLPTSKSAVSI
jgi:hypothetical protein